jgi:hypothetical protein
MEPAPTQHGCVPVRRLRRWVRWWVIGVSRSVIVVAVQAPGGPSAALRVGLRRDLGVYVGAGWAGLLAMVGFVEPKEASIRGILSPSSPVFAEP